MPAQYLDEFIRELRRDGDATFRAEHDVPVLIVTRAAGEVSNDKGAETTVMADTSGWRIQQVSLLNRIFRVSRGAFETARPILLGRTDTCDISIPDDSVSKRHCAFEVRGGSMTITDLGSTNGTTVNDTAVAPNTFVPLQGGDAISTGNFSFQYHTPDTFIAYLKRVVKL
jgi:pSer/pThr/pTyr-binding forkhead associated (FHA) protein